MRLTALVVLFLLSFVLITPASAAVRVPILMYHYIGYNPNPKDTQRDALSVTPDKFEAQLTYLQQHGFTPITLDTLSAVFRGQASYSKPIVLTFDDGYIDFYTTSFPILRKYGFHAVSFIPTGLMNQGYYMSWSQIKEIQSSGLVSFEDHSVTHTDLALLRQSRVEQELRDSKYILQTMTSIPINFVAYPYGTSNSLVQSIAKKLGFVGGLGTWYGKATGINLNMPRIRVSGQMSLRDFASRL